MASLILGLALAGCNADTDKATTAASTATPPATAAPSPTPTPAPAATGSSAAPGTPRYTVRRTRPASGESGASAVLVLAKESTAEARAAIGDYFRRTPTTGFLAVEALGRADGTEWICMGERVTSEGDKQYAIFEGTQAITTFPSEWIECRD